MIIGTNIKKGSTLEWFTHVLALNLSYEAHENIITHSLKENVYKYTQRLLGLDRCPSEIPSLYLPNFGYTVKEHVDLLMSTCYISPQLFYPSTSSTSSIYLLLDVETEQDIQFLRSNKGILVNIYKDKSDIDRRFDLNIEFNGLKYLNISNYLTNYITCYEN